MSLEAARRYGAAVDEEDWDTALAQLHPEVEVTRPSGRTYSGADAWIRLLSRSRGFRNLDTRCENREYAERDGAVVEVRDIVHRWQHDGSLAYSSREETLITFRDGLIAGMRSTVEHREPDEAETAAA